MSEILINCHNIIVTGYLTKNTSVYYSDEISDKTMADAISLQFTLLINGRMQTFPLYFTLDKGFYLGEYAKSRWDTIEETLFNLGYYLRETKELGLGKTNLLTEWIEKLNNNKS